MTGRDQTIRIRVGDVYIGGGSPVTLQSMTNTATGDIVSTLDQIRRLEEAGCDIIRLAVPDMEACEAIKIIKKRSHAPIVADIHFNYLLALECIKNGVDKIRINPGNIGDKDRVRQVARMCSERSVPIRVGVNGGSLSKAILAEYNNKVTPEAITKSAMQQIEILESVGFTDIAVSLKCSDVNMTIESYKLMSNIVHYPLHVGITEAGTYRNGVIRSCAGIGAILSLGIGDTIRVSLTGDPVEEVRVGRSLLQALDLSSKSKVNFISCPTCGRTRVDLINIASNIEDALAELEKQGVIHKNITVAVMGCAVNGPGEASHADIGLAGGVGEMLLFKKGKVIKKITEDSVVEEFIRYVIEEAN